MLEGYFKVSTYAKLCGIKIDTAWHRVQRRSVESIIGKNGEWYVYYNEANEKEYILLSDYCREHDVRPTAVYARIQRGALMEPDIRRMHKWIYIRKDYEWVAFNPGRNNTFRTHKSKPEGYLTVTEWCLKNSMNAGTARLYIHKGKIDVVRINGHVYIPKDYIYASNRKKNKGPNECDMKGGNRWDLYSEPLLSD